MKFESFSGLEYFKIGNYTDQGGTTNDYSNIPRPFNNIAMMIEGKGEITLPEGESFEIEKGDILVIPIGTRYRSRWIGRDVHFITFHFNVSVLSDVFMGADVKIQKIKTDDYTMFAERFKEAYENFNGGVSEQLYSLGEFYKVLGYVTDNIEEDVFNRVKDRRIVDVMEFIKENYNKRLTVRDCAKHIYMSEAWVYFNFKQETGMTPVEFKNRIMINHASILLLSTRKSIEEISEEAGYASSDYFRRTFKKIMGMSPQKYRNTPIGI